MLSFVYFIKAVLIFSNHAFMYMYTAQNYLIFCDQFREFDKNEPHFEKWCCVVFV